LRKSIWGVGNLVLPSLPTTRTSSLQHGQSKRTKPLSYPCFLKPVDKQGAAHPHPPQNSHNKPTASAGQQWASGWSHSAPRSSEAAALNVLQEPHQPSWWPWGKRPSLLDSTEPI
jgi:hypothetical protein